MEQTDPTQLHQQGILLHQTLYAIFSSHIQLPTAIARTDSSPEKSI